jgi:DNA polymerase epsilon subunit 3
MSPTAASASTTAESTKTDETSGASSSNALKDTPQTSNSASHGGAGNSSSTSAEFEPPLACIRRILKQALPKSTNVGKDASMAFSRACGIFCIYLTTCANDFARENKRSTITAADVLAAMKELDFDEFVPQLETFLEDHRADEKRKKEAKSQIMEAIHTEKRAEKSGVGSAAKKTSEPDPKKQKSAPAEGAPGDDATDSGEHEHEHDNDIEDEEEEDGDGEDDDDNNEEDDDDEVSMDDDKEDGEGEGVADEGDENEESEEIQPNEDMQE